jgi:hypothetical protein
VRQPADRADELGHFEAGGVAPEEEVEHFRIQDFDEVFALDFEVLELRKAVRPIVVARQHVDVLDVFVPNVQVKLADVPALLPDDCKRQREGFLNHLIFSQQTQ